MKKYLITTLIFLSANALAARDVVIVIPNVPTTEEVKETTSDWWNSAVEATKEGTRKAGELTGRILEQSGQKLQEYSATDKPTDTLQKSPNDTNVIIDKK